MENMNTASCESCGRPVPDGRIVCKCCEACNGYSAAKWLAQRILAEQNNPEKGK